MSNGPGPTIALTKELFWGPKPVRIGPGNRTMLSRQSRRTSRFSGHDLRIIRAEKGVGRPPMAAK